jgi:hypothetical protein
MSVASKAQARLTIAKEVKAAIKRLLGLKLSTATSSFSFDSVFEPDMMSILCSTRRRSVEQKSRRRRRRKSNHHDSGMWQKGLLYLCGISRINFLALSKKRTQVLSPCLTARFSRSKALQLTSKKSIS